MAFAKQTLYCKQESKMIVIGTTSFERRPTRYEHCLSRLLKMIILFVTLFDVTHADSNSRCDPFDIGSCRFGGECTSVSTYYFGIDFQPSEYRCRCVYVDFTAHGQEFVCGRNPQGHEQ